MSQPDETLSLPPSPSFDTLSRSCLSPIPTDEPPAGHSFENPASRLDHVFNFQLVVFEVENKLFQVLRNGFNVPGTPFEAIFALAQTPTDSDSVEGSSLENPIYLPVKAVHFRSFLRILYPFIDQTPVVGFDEWVGVLNLATMWFFQDIREKAISKLSGLINQKTVMERIALAREYRVAKWLRDAYLELAKTRPLDFDELRPAEPCSKDRNWEAAARDWETLARICYLQTKVAASTSGSDYCYDCRLYNSACDCRLLPMVNEAFRGELESFKENPGHVEHPLPPFITDSDSVALPEVVPEVVSGGSTTVKKKKKGVKKC